MKTIKFSFFCLCFMSTAVLAGPAVTVTFKNQSSQDASMLVETQAELLSFADSTPKPEPTVEAGESNVYTVQNKFLPEFNQAYVHYRMGSKHCVFKTVYTKDSRNIPKWTNTETPSGGASCQSTVTSVNPATHAWSIEFRMR